MQVVWEWCEQQMCYGGFSGWPSFFSPELSRGCRPPSPASSTPKWDQIRNTQMLVKKAYTILANIGLESFSLVHCWPLLSISGSWHMSGWL